MSDKIRAPWTPEQVTALHEFQHRGGMHPFTCGHEHPAHPNAILEATTHGWRCYVLDCEYTQDWAHTFMADPGAWPKWQPDVPDAVQPEDTCRSVEIGGEIVSVRGAGEFTDRDREFAAEIVRAAKRKFEAEPVLTQLRQEIAGVLRDAPGRWNIRVRTDAVMAALDRFLDIGDAEAWCKTCRRVWDGKAHRCESDAEQRLSRIRDALAAFSDQGVMREGHVNVDVPTVSEVIAAVRAELDRPEEAA